MTIIATYEAPKQRATIHYGIRLIKTRDVYTTETYLIENGIPVQTLNTSRSIENAWAQFHAAIVEKSTYGPGTWEEIV